MLLSLSVHLTTLSQTKEVNYHYLLVEVAHQRLRVAMNRLELNNRKAVV
jgi:hypothetical protein